MVVVVVVVTHGWSMRAANGELGLHWKIAHFYCVAHSTCCGPVVSVCVSVMRWYYAQTDERFEMFATSRLPSTNPTLCVIGSWQIPRNKLISLWSLHSKPCRGKHTFCFHLWPLTLIFSPRRAMVMTRAAVRLKFLIAINLAIEKLISVNLTINRKVKTRQYLSIIIQSTVHFTQKSHPRPNTRVQSHNAGFEVTVITGPTRY